MRSVRKSAWLIMGIMTVFFREIITIHEGNLVLDQAHSIFFHDGTGLSLKASQPCFGCEFSPLEGLGSPTVLASQAASTYPLARQMAPGATPACVPWPHS